MLQHATRHRTAPDAPLRVRARVPAGADVPVVDDEVTLDCDERRKRRFVFDCEGGTQILLDFEVAPHLRDGDLLQLEDGRYIRVNAAREALTEVRPGRRITLVELAYHLGNRHVEAQVFDNRIVIRRDHVIENMLRDLGAAIRFVEDAFDPVGGAYAHADGHADTHADAIGKTP